MTGKNELNLSFGFVMLTTIVGTNYIIAKARPGVIIAI